jgi:hypothetical protein
MLVEDLLDLPGVDVITAADDHVFLSVNDVEIALLIHAADIPGIKPTIAQT